MLTTKTINGQAYHAYEDDGRLVLDENNKPILAHICICSAWSASECCCGAWDTPIPDSYPFNDGDAAENNDI